MVPLPVSKSAGICCSVSSDGTGAAMAKNASITEQDGRMGCPRGAKVTRMSEMLRRCQRGTADSLYTTMPAGSVAHRQ